MTKDDFRDPRLTERRNPATSDLDVASSLGIVDMLNAEDRRVPEAVRGAREQISRVIDAVVEGFSGGGRLIYVGAGTSGRLGVLDAAECPPTFGTPPELVIGIIAGGAAALTRSQEGAEDDREAGARAMADAGVSRADVVVGIAASGTTPYVAAALASSKARGAFVALITCSDPPAALGNVLDERVVIPVGPEALTGSTRLKAGTATKLVLNTISTGAMIRSGRVYGNLMVDLTALSDKLRDRGERIIMETCAVNRDAARRAIDAAEGSVKRAIVMVRNGVNVRDADRLLAEGGGFVRNAVGAPPPVSEYQC